MDNILFPEIEFKLESPFTRDEIQVADEQILQSFNCPFCLQLVWNPICCNKCGKTYCKKCLKEYSINRNHYRHCIFKCGSNNYRNMTNKEKEFIDCIKLKCRNNGCNKFINYLDYKSHFKNCDYRLYQCYHDGCGKEVPFCNFRDHVSNCEWRDINCPKCHKVIIFNSIDAHKQNDCLEEIVKCDICGEEMRRIDYINIHKPNYVECIKKITLINYKEIMEYKKELIKQQEINKNMENIINQNKVKINENEKNIKLLMEENESLKKKNKENEKIIEQCKLLMENDNNKLGNKNISDALSLTINNENQKKENQNLNFNYISPNFLLNKRKRNNYSNIDDN